MDEETIDEAVRDGLITIGGLYNLVALLSDTVRCLTPLGDINSIVSRRSQFDLTKGDYILENIDFLVRALGDLKMSIEKREQ